MRVAQPPISAITVALQMLKYFVTNLVFYWLQLKAFTGVPLIKIFIHTKRNALFRQSGYILHATNVGKVICEEAGITLLLHQLRVAMLLWKLLGLIPVRHYVLNLLVATHIDGVVAAHIHLNAFSCLLLIRLKEFRIDIVFANQLVQLELLFLGAPKGRDGGFITSLIQRIHIYFKIVN